MYALVVLPTYNESRTLSEALDRIIAADPRADVLVVDDGSPDGTGAIADRRAEADSRIHVLHRTSKQGLGAAYRAGFAWGLDRGYPVLVEMDADLSHPAERLPALIDATGVADVAIGSRYIAGAGTRNWPRSRQAISRGGNLYVRAALSVPVRDATAGFRAYRAEVLRALPIEQIRSEGYCFQIEATHRAWQLGFSLTEVPIIFTERSEGESKMSSKIVVEALSRVAWWAMTGGRRGPVVAHPHSLSRGAETVPIAS